MSFPNINQTDKPSETIITSFSKSLDKEVQISIREYLRLNYRNKLCYAILVFFSILAGVFAAKIEL